MFEKLFDIYETVACEDTTAASVYTIAALTFSLIVHRPLPESLRLTVQFNGTQKLCHYSWKIWWILSVYPFDIDNLASL